MKRIGLTVLIVALLAAAGFSGMKRVTTLEGTKYDTLSNSDTVMFRPGMSQYPITKATGDKTYDGMIACFYIPNATSIGSAPDSLGSLDTAIVQIKTGKGYWERTIAADTGVPPCTLFFQVSADPWYGGAEKGYEDGDTLMVYWQPQDSAITSFLLDNIWFDYRFADTSGSGDTLQFYFNYWIRLYEED